MQSPQRQQATRKESRIFLFIYMDLFDNWMAIRQDKPIPNQLHSAFLDIVQNQYVTSCITFLNRHGKMDEPDQASSFGSRRALSRKQEQAAMRRGKESRSDATRVTEGCRLTATAIRR